MSVAEFVKEYVSGRDKGKVDFRWNGKHATEFIDDNLNFRMQVILYIIDSFKVHKLPLELLIDVFIAESKCSKESWGVNKYYRNICEYVIRNGNEDIVLIILEGIHSSMDTYLSCASLVFDKKDEPLIMNYINALEALEGKEHDTKVVKLISSGKRLFKSYIEKMSVM